MELRGKVILVTGASSGIGKAIAIAFANKSAHVLVHYGRNEAGALETLQRNRERVKRRLYKADLMNPDDITSLFNELNRTTPTIDVLANNAGDAQAGDITNNTMWEYEYKNILLSAVHITQQFLLIQSLLLRKIINITSLYGNLHTGEPQYVQYSAFKAALAQLTTTMNKSTAPNVIANAIAPGYTETPAWAGASKEVVEAYARTTLIGRFLKPEEIAHAAIFIAENDALVGQVLTLDGGTSLKGMP